MNLGLFENLFEDRPSQHKPEWRFFLEICEMYIKKHEIKHPVVVELGLWRNKQKQFWNQLLGAEHIGIDFSTRRCTPDIHGHLHDTATVAMLKEKLKGRPINILFIDGSHFYRNVKKDYEMYSPLCNGIIALHDIESCRHVGRKKAEAWKFWDELKTMAWHGAEEHKNSLFLSIFQHKVGAMGIGVIIKQ